MTKTALTVALAAMMTAAAPLAYAQTTAPMQNTPSTSRATQSSFTTGSGELRASKLIGSSVYDVQNEKIGSVQDIVLDRDGKVAGVIIDVGSFLGAGGKNVAISLNDIKMTNDRLTLDRSKDQLKSAQPYHLTNDKNG